MIVDKLGFYLTRGEEIVKVIEISSDKEVNYPILVVKLETSHQYTTTKEGKVLFRLDGQDLVKYLSKEKYPEMYL